MPLSRRRFLALLPTTVGAAVWSAPSIRPDGTLVVADRSGRVLVLGDS